MQRSAALLRQRRIAVRFAPQRKPKETTMQRKLTRKQILSIIRRAELRSYRYGK